MRTTRANVWGVAGTGLGFSRSLALRQPSIYDALVRSLLNGEVTEASSAPHFLAVVISESFWTCFSILDSISATVCLCSS